MKSKYIKTPLIYTFIILALGGFFSLIKNMDNKIENPEVKVWSFRVPFSTDPLEYDALAHHICFRSLYASLVTEYKLGEIQGVVADSWTSNAKQDAWTFHIRKNLQFSNGDVITPKIVAESINRAAYIMKKGNSEAGLLEFLNGFSSIKSAGELISGIKYDAENVYLVFTKTMTSVLTKISFGIYSIAHPSQYDHMTGVWKDPRALISSGPYTIKEWGQDTLSLELRSNFPKEALLSNPLKRVRFFFSPETLKNSDIIVDFDDSIAANADYVFYGPVKSAIKYAECSNWQNKESLCSDKSTRLRLRELFYEQYRKTKGDAFAQSFFPLAIKGTKETVTGSYATFDDSKLKGKLVINSAPVAVKNDKNAQVLTSHQAFAESFLRLADAKGLNLEIFTPPKNNIFDGNVDIRFRMTAILVDSPIHDIQFMLLSGQGIKLPDETGKIKELVKNENFDVQTVNQMLWDQGIVWPLGHMALGIWVKKNSDININKYNAILPPLDLQWLEFN